MASLNPRWIGPYQIKETHPSGVYVCQSVTDPSDWRKVPHQDVQLRKITPETNIDSQSILTPPYYQSSSCPYPQNKSTPKCGSSYDSITSDLSSQTSYRPQNIPVFDTHNKHHSGAENYPLKERPKRHIKANRKYNSSSWTK